MDETAPPPFSQTQHMRTMFDLYMRAGAGAGLRMGTVTLNDLYALWCSAFQEGVWTQRAHPAPRSKRKRPA